MYDSNGSLRVRAFTAGGALPVSNVLIRLWGIDEENRETVRSLITDRDGVGVFSDLPTPNIKYSMTPTPAERPYALYRLEAVADGYAPRAVEELQVFSGIESFQPLNLIPALDSEIIN